jgi:drug/metabolite transporter (DMT)-like permease
MIRERYYSMGPGSRGLGVAVLSAATFGTSGTFATALLDAGWTPLAAVTARLTVAALILTIPGALALRRSWPALRSAGPRARRASAGMVVLYGLIAVAGCQLFYFEAVQRLSVGVALMLEYLGVVLVVLWLWVRHHQRPGRLTVLGSAASLVGLAFVLDLFGQQHLDFIGVLWGLSAAVGLALYFFLSARADDLLPPIVMAWGATTIGALTLIALGALRVLPVHANFGQVSFASHRTSWVVPVAGLALIGTVVAYLLGIAAARVLGAKLASFVGLLEVVFAVLFAWLFLAQLPSGVQLVGGAFIVGGVALVRVDELRAARLLGGGVLDAHQQNDPIGAV